MNKHRILTILKVAFVVAFLISLFAAIEFGLPLLRSLIPEATDGIPAPGAIMQLFFGEDGWTRLEYFNMVTKSIYISFASLLGYIIVSLVDNKKSW